MGRTNIFGQQHLSFALIFFGHRTCPCALPAKLQERHDVRPDSIYYNIVVEVLKREQSVERVGRRAVALAPAEADEAVLDAEEERGAEGDGGKASGGQRAQEGQDSGALVVQDGDVQGNAASLAFDEQG